MIRAVAKLLKAMNSDAGPGQISLAFCLSMVAGFTPFWSLHNVLVLFLVTVLKVNFSAFVLGLGLFSGAAYLLDPVFHSAGLWILAAPPLEGLWTAMYNSAFWRLERFNNTIVMGSLTVSLALFVPLFFIARTGIVRYREHVLEWARKTRIAQFIKGTKLYKIYRSLSELREGL